MGEHTLNCQLHSHLGSLSHQFLVLDGLHTADVTGVVVVVLLLQLLAGQNCLICVNDNNEVTAVYVGGESGVVLAAEQVSSGNIFVAEYPDGTTKVLEDTVVDGRNISIAMEGDVTLYVIDQSAGFPDVPNDYWAKAEIDYMTSRGLMKGKLDGTFAPGETITRGTVAMMLWRMAGEPEVEGASPFSDVTGGRYLMPILWAQQNEIIKGYEDGTFRPNATISRMHFCVMLHRYALFQGYLLPAVTDTELSGFADYSAIYGWARESCQWAVTCGIVNGRKDGTYDPMGGTSRAQMAVILCRFLQAVNQSENID